MIDGNGKIILNGRSINEPYVMNFCPSKPKFNICPQMNSTVPIGHVFVLGITVLIVGIVVFGQEGGFYRIKK